MQPDCSAYRDDAEVLAFLGIAHPRSVSAVPNSSQRAATTGRARQPSGRINGKFFPRGCPCAHVSATAMVGEMFPPHRDPPTRDPHHASGQPTASTRNKATNASPEEVAHDLPIAPGTPPLRAGQEATVSTRPATPATMTHDHHAKAVASGSLQLPRLEPILSAAWQTVAA